MLKLFCLKHKALLQIPQYYVSQIPPTPLISIETPIVIVNSLIKAKPIPELTKEEQRQLTIKLSKFLMKYVIPNTKQDSQVTKAMFMQYFYLALGKAFFFSGPWCLKLGVNYLNNPAMIHFAPYMFVGYGACYTAYVVFEGLRNYHSSIISQHAMNDVAIKTYQHLLNMDHEVHIASSSRSSLFSIYKAQKSIESNLRSINQYFVPMTLDVIITSALLNYNFGFPFLVTFAATYVGYAVLTLTYANVRVKGVSQAKQQEKKADFTINQALQNFFTIKYFNAEKYELFRYKNILDKFQKLQLVNIKTLGRLNSMQRGVFSLGLTISLLIGVAKVQAGILTAGDIILLQALMMQLFGPLFFLGTMHREWTESLLDIKDLFKILDLKPKIQEPKNPQQFEYKTGSLKFENVSFTFNENKQILKNLSLEIQGGEWVTIVGESGVGKSTLFNLIFRLLDPQQGQILIDGQPLNQLQFNSFRRHFGVVSQQSYLFNDTVRNNLMYGVDIQESFTEEQIKEKESQMKDLCKKLGLSEVIEKLPQGYDTMLGDQANKFSGGEKQRLQIVRCMLRGAKILLLDEPTSALDSKNEHKFIKMLESVLKVQENLTVLIISHRLHFANITDKVLYLGNNNIAEFGSQKELLANSKGYAKLWEKNQIKE